MNKTVKKLCFVYPLLIILSLLLFLFLWNTVFADERNVFENILNEDRMIVKDLLMLHYLI